MLGIAAMLGTGVFVMWGPVIDLAGAYVLMAVVVAGAVAALNAWSTARLAMAHPEAGGAYAYGRLRLNRFAGVTAGAAFLIGKCASAGAAALAIGTYLWPEQTRLVAVIVVGVALLIDVRGVRRSVTVSGMLAVIVVLVLGASSASVFTLSTGGVLPPGTSPLQVLAAAALCFFAFAGYARIAVLGEEVRDPVRTIPRAMIISLAFVAVVYLVVGWAMTHAAQSGIVLGTTGVLAAVRSWPVLVIAVQGAIVLAAGAALLALITGISRTLFAMARNGDAPRAFAQLHGALPRRAQLAAAALVLAVVLVGQVLWAIALSAVTILIYYAVAHLAARTLPIGQRPPAAVPILGLAGCLGLITALVLTGTA